MLFLLMTAELWLSVWSIVCCLSTALTFATFLLDPSRYYNLLAISVYLTQLNCNIYISKYNNIIIFLKVLI